jgi:predicted dehydrogenase
VEDSGVAVFTFAGGVRAEITSAWNLVAAEQSVEIFGTEGTAVLSGVDLASRDFAAAPHLRVHRRGDPRGTWRAVGGIPLFVQGVTHRQAPRHLVDCVRDGRTPLAGLDEGRRSLAMILAAYRAAGSGVRQPVAGETSAP